ncbi:MAG TPA: serine hydrolase [Candidatus Binataceae bacterium]|nr:serine hydrolase [Candidatus Binataceae bacterium]
MKKLLVLALILLLGAAARASAATSCPASLFDQVSAIVQPQLDTHPELKLAAVVGIVEPASDGAVLTHIFYFGHAVDSNGAPLTLDGATEFEIGSVSKTFTAAIFASLLERNGSLFKLPTNRIFRQTPAFMGQQTTLGDLSNYTSGLPDSNRGLGSDSCTFGGGTITNCFDLELMFQNLSDTALSGLAFLPGSEFLYSDLGYALLALAEPVLGGLVKKNPGQLRLPDRLLQGWETMLGSIVLQPLGMNSTHAFDPAIDPPVLPKGFHSDLSGKVTTALDHNTSWPSYIGAGGIVSTPNDMMLYLEFNLGLLHNALNRLLPLLQTPSTKVVTGSGEQLAIGWFIATLKLGASGIPYINKNGGVPAFTTQVDLAPSTGTGVFVLTNVASDKGADRIVDVRTIAYQVLQIINKSTPTTPPDTSDEP